MQRLHLLRYGVGILHVAVLVAVIAHQADGVLPDACFLIISIAVYLVNHDGGVSSRACRDASYSDVSLFCQQVGTFVVVQQCEVVVAHVTAGMAV